MRSDTSSEGGAGAGVPRDGDNGGGLRAGPCGRAWWRDTSAATVVVVNEYSVKRIGCILYSRRSCIRAAVYATDL